MRSAPQKLQLIVSMGSGRNHRKYQGRRCQGGA
jgi:hypothetical protein